MKRIKPSQTRVGAEAAPSSIVEILRRRRKSWSFRMANMLVMATVFGGYAPSGVMAGVAAGYLLHQAWELQGLSRLSPTWRRYDAVALATLASGSLIFGLPALLWSGFVGMPGLLSGGFLLGGAALNSLLGTKGCRRCLFASTIPFLAYLGLATLLVVLPRYGAVDLARVGISSGAMCLAGLKFWLDSSRTYASEQAAYHDIRLNKVQLELALEAAQAADQAKSEFLANMSHEIRTPLNGILTTAEVLHLQSGDGEQRRLLRLIRQSGRDLQRILSDVLDLSKITSGQMEIESVAFDPAEEIGSLMATFAPLAEKKGLGLDLHLAPEASWLRFGDPVRLRQMVANLVSNALKFTSEGRVRVEVTGLREGRDGLQIVVSDTGPGIAPDKMERLFKRFSQLDSSTTRRFGGTGLGLAICKQLAELMGGDVWVESQVGVGSVFHAVLSIPRAEPARAPVGAPAVDAPAQASEPYERVRVLAADDNATNRVVLSKLMEMFGFELTVVADGVQAVQAWRVQDFDLVLMDIQMPEMDGIEATGQIRAQEKALGRLRTPILALSANAFDHQVASYLASGMDGHVAKPIDVNSLRWAIEDVFARSCAGADEISEDTFELAATA